MSTLTRKEDLLDLLKKPEFLDMLFINSEQEYDEQPKNVKSNFHQYHATEWDEHTSGVDLFYTPRKHNGLGEQWGTWLEVVKLYGNYELPYRVRALEYVPWGSDIDASTVGDYKTLGQALDAAFNIHDHGSIELHVIEEDLDEGRYVKGDSRIEAPETDAEVISEVALAVNQLVSNQAVLQEVKKQALAKERALLNLIHREAWSAPVPLEEAKPIVAQFAKLLEDRKLGGSTDSMLVAASVINTQLFAGNASLISYHCSPLKDMFDQHGAVFAIVERSERDYVYLSTECGVQEGFQNARSAATALLEKQYEQEKVDPGRYWLHDELWEIDFTDLLIEEEKNVVIDTPDEFNPHPHDEYLILEAMREAVTPYREALKEKIGPVIREREGKANLKSVEETSLSL